MKKFFKIFGISVAVIVGVLLISVGVYALVGGFEEHVVGLTNIYFDNETEKEKRLIIEDDVELTINFAPLDATEKTLKTNVSDLSDTACVQVPETITVGEPFKILVKKDENGRNIGGNAYIEFGSYDKDSVSNLIAPCKLQITVDVPVENADLKFTSNLRYVSSVDRPNQYIISKNNYSTPFYLYSNKSNIFDINQWSESENKEIYFSYLEDGDDAYTSIEVRSSSDVLNSLEPVDCTFNNKEDRYELYFYPGRIDANVLSVNAKVHRSYAIQQEFKTSGFEEFEKTYLKRSVSDLLQDATFMNLLSSYSSFLDKYYINYFASGNPEAMRFFTNLSPNGYVNLPASEEIKDIIYQSLQYVYVVHSIQFYVSDVKIKSFSVDDEVKEMNLIDFDDNNNKTRTEEVYVLTDANDSSKQGLFTKFDIKLYATNSSQSSTSIDDVAMQDLMSSVTIDVLVYDASGKSLMSGQKVSFPANSNSSSNWASFLKEIGEDDSIVNNTSIFGYNEQYLTVENVYNANTNEQTWVFNKLVPSKSSGFQIYLMFTLQVNDEDGEQTFFDFARVNIVENSDTARSGETLNERLDISDTMYVYTNEEVYSGEKGLEYRGLTGKIQDVSVTTAEAGSYKSTFDSFKLFAYVGTETIVNNTKAVSYDSEYSIVSESYFDETVTYNVLSNHLTLPNGVKSTRLCKFTNLDGQILIFDTVAGGVGKEAYFTDLVGNTQQNVVYAYEIDWEDLEALSASSNRVQIFACYVLTDANNIPIDREGCVLLNDNGAMITKEGNTYSYNATDPSKSTGEFIMVDGVATQVINYIALQDIAFKHSVQVKSVIENIYYYTVLDTAVELLEKEQNSDYYVKKAYDKGSYILRNDNSRLFESELKLIIDNTYNDILTVLPYDIDVRVNGLDIIPEPATEEDFIKNNLALNNHKLLTNQVLAYKTAIENSDGGLGFSLDENYGVLRVNKDHALDNSVTYGNTNKSIHPIYLSIEANKAVPSDSVDRPQVALSTEYKDNAVFIPYNAVVTVEVYEVRITDFDNLFVASGDALGKEQITVTGTVDKGWNWSSGFYQNDINHPVIFDTTTNNKIDKILVSNNANISSNLLNGVNVDDAGNISFNLGETIKEIVQNPDGSNETIDTGKYESNVTAYSNSILDISKLNSEYIETCIINYLFDTSASGNLSYSDLVDYVNNTVLKNTANIYNTINIEYTTNTQSSTLGEMYVNVHDMYKGTPEEKISIPATEYYQYFDGYASNTVIYNAIDKEGNPYQYIRVKVVNINEDKNGSLTSLYVLPLKTATEHFGFTFDTIWTFGGQTEEKYTITKSYDVVVEFKTPTFKIADSWVENGIQKQISVNAGDSTDLTQYIVAEYPAEGTMPKTELKDKVTFTITNTNYGYFVDDTDNTKKLYSVTGKFSGQNLYLYDSSNNRTLNITVSMLGVQDINLTISIAGNITKTNNASSSKLVTYSAFNNLYNNTNINYTTNTDTITYSMSDTSTTTINVQPYTIADNTISYDMNDLVQIVKISNNMITAFSLTKIRYKDLTGEYQEVTVSNNKYTFSSSVSVEMIDTLLKITGEIYTELEVTFKINSFNGGLNLSPDDTIHSNQYTVKIYPILKVTKSNWISKTSNYYVYDSTSKLFVNNSTLYNDTFGLAIMSEFSTVPLYSTEKLNLTESQIEFTKTNGNTQSDILTAWKWKEEDIKAQFFERTKNTTTNVWEYKNDYTDLGVLVYSSDDYVNISNGTLNLSPLPQSFILPVTVNFNGAFLGISGDSLNLMLPIGGYDIQYKGTIDATSYVSAQYDYENKKFISADGLSDIVISLPAGKVYELTDYIRVSYAGNALGLIEGGSIATSCNLDFVDVDEIGTSDMSYGSLSGLSLTLNSVVDVSSNIRYAFETKGYTTRQGSVETSYEFNGNISFYINILPNISMNFVGGGMVINNDLSADITGTTGVKLTSGYDLVEFVKAYFKFDTSAFDLIEVTATSFKYAMFVTENGVKRATSTYLLFDFGQNSVIDTSTNKFITVSEDITIENYAVVINQDVNGRTFSSALDLVIKA